MKIRHECVAHEKAINDNIELTKKERCVVHTMCMLHLLRASNYCDGIIDGKSIRWLIWKGNIFNDMLNYLILWETSMPHSELARGCKSHGRLLWLFDFL